MQQREIIRLVLDFTAGRLGMDATVERTTGPDPRR
jgi:hypothetical protein